MTSNDQVLIQSHLDERQRTDKASRSVDVLFEVFAAEQATKSLELTPEEVEAGIVGGGNDGGIDAGYISLGGKLLPEDAEVYDESIPPSSFAREQRLGLHIVQAKTSASFTETAVDLLASSLGRILEMGTSAESLAELYNEDIVSLAERFRTAWKRLAPRQVKVHVEVIYASQGVVAQVNQKVKRKAQDLKGVLTELVSGGDCAVRFLGAKELWEEFSRVPSYDLDLVYTENATQGNSHVALVSLENYFEFLRDETGALRGHIFDWNVRDFQGGVEVNKEIANSLETDQSVEFWWLNNGVTIICKSATLASKTFSLLDVQIVNGLQTSHTIYQAMSSSDDLSNFAKSRAVLVRILVTEDMTVRDKVIRATNRQTAVGVASLRATDPIQRKIESHFEQHGWYYDRRKNYWRNMGKPTERILSIPMVAQSLLACGLAEPNNARARPSSLLKNNSDYERIFTDKIPLHVYLWAAKTQKWADANLTGALVGASTHQKTNLRFYTTMLLAWRAVGNPVSSPLQLVTLSSRDHTFTLRQLKQAYVRVESHASDLMKEQDLTLDQVAKSRDLVTRVRTKESPRIKAAGKARKGKSTK